MGRAVDDGGVDDLAAAARAGLEQRGEHADDEVERAAAEVADEVDRHLGWSAGPADGVQGAGDGDVADVVTGRLRERAVLAPAGHPAVDEPRVAGETVVGAEAEPLGDAGAVALEEDVGLLDEGERGREPVGVLEVEDDGGATAAQQVGLGRQRHRQRGLTGPVDAG